MSNDQRQVPVLDVRAVVACCAKHLEREDIALISWAAMTHTEKFHALTNGELQPGSRANENEVARAMLRVAKRCQAEGGALQ